MPPQVKDIKIVLPKKAPRHEHSYLLDLRGCGNSVPKSRPKITDIAKPLSKIPKLCLFFYQKPKNTIPEPLLKNELFRLAVFALAIVFFFNIFNVYYRALDFRSSLAADANQGFSSLLTASQAVISNDSKKADAIFSQAFDEFENALRDIARLGSFAENFGGRGELFSAASNILKSGKSLASAGSYFTSAMEGFRHVFSRMTDPTAKKPSLTDQLTEHHEKLLAALYDLSFALTYLSKVNPEVLPQEMQPLFETSRSKIETFQKTALRLDSYFPALLRLLGDRYPHRILVLLQNNNEIRPGGGFIGSFLLLDLNDGALSFSFHDVYDFDRNLHEFVAPPLEIANVTDTWRMRDSNYSPHFPLSAKKAAWFLEKEQGPGVDSVFAVDLSFARELLTIIGPVTVDGVTYDRNNFDFLLSYSIESKLDGLEDPKMILRSFLPAAREKLFSEGNAAAFLSVLLRGFQSKHVALYSKDPEIQQFFHDFGLSGEFEKKSLDFLSVVHSSIGGNKSDRFMEESLTHRTVVERDGRVLSQLTIQRQNTYSAETEQALLKILRSAGFGIPQPEVMVILGQGENVVGTRIYVPKGSVLREHLGADSVTTHEDPELNLTYFYTTLSTGAGETTELTLTYELPFQLGDGVIDEYSFQVEKQPGMPDFVLKKELFVDPALTVYRVSPDFKESGKGYWVFEGEVVASAEMSALVGN